MSEISREEMGRLGGLKISADREYMRKIGAKGGRKTARKPGHMERMTQASIEARNANKKSKSNARK